MHSCRRTEDVTTFLRVLDPKPEQKGAAIRAATARWRLGGNSEGIFQVEPESFQQVPGSPFAYWVSDRVRGLFAELPPFESDDRTVKQGLATADDFRFVRMWWEVEAGRAGTKWFPFAKGGAFSPYYMDIHPVANWEDDGREIKNFSDRETGRTYSRPQNTSFYFRPGLTWPLRGIQFSAQAVPADSVFSVAGKMAFPRESELGGALALFNSRPFDAIVRLFAGKVGGVQYEVGLIGAVRYPLPGKALQRLGPEGWAHRRRLDTVAHISHAFLLPGLLQATGSSLASRTEAWSALITQTQSDLARIQSEIDDIAFELYGLDGEDRRQMEEGFGSLGGAEEPNGEADEDDDEEGETEGADSRALTESLLEWTLGVALGRFDLRLATGDRAPPPVPEPFDPLPVCSPGMLHDEGGLPAREAPPGYPLELPPHGILVDDPGHPWDVMARMEAVMEQVAGDRAHAWIQEAEAILGRDLRDWLRRYAFERHLKRYSRSRRKAPIFWHLAPKSREYGLWLYSPHATRDTFYRILNDYLDPRLRVAERRLVELRQEAGDAPTGGQRRDLASQESLVDELRAFREEVARVAPLWKPHQDDGVVLNCAVLWRLFSHHRAWQSECKKKWGELAKGKYDWAGWAMHLWPDRVVRACTEDRSLAIAHGLEVALWEEDDDGTWRLHGDADGQAHSLTEQRRSPAVEAALDAFMRAD
jgi:hypothetical protein